MKTIDLLLFLFWKRISDTLTAVAIWITRMALAHYVSAKLGYRFAMRKLDTNIFIAVYYSTVTRKVEVGTVFVDENAETAKQRLIDTQGAQILFWISLAELRWKAVENLKQEVRYIG